MRKTICLLPILFLTLITLTGCEKERDTTPPKTKTELLTSGSWKFSSATVAGVDASGVLLPCQKDNSMVFVAAGTGTVDEGASKCDAADPQTRPFTWNLTNTETNLFISTALFNGGSSTFNILILSETQLVVLQNVLIGGSSQQMIVTFVH